MTLRHPLIDATALRERLAARLPTVVLDCSFELTQPAAGAAQFEQAHIPGAQHADLEADLSGPKSPAGPREGGRHPLPARPDWARVLGRWGLAPGVLAVAYDRQGSMYAARAWWLLRWAGHVDAVVLDGGLAAWQAAGGALASGRAPERVDAPPYPLAQAPAMPTTSADALWAARARLTVVDARAGERFRGEAEPLDARAGHIPGAVNRFFKDNLDADGRFAGAHELRRAFEMLGAADPVRVVHHCGSGVTGCHNVLAMEIAGLPGAALYPGSWSEWSADSTRPVATGA